MLGKVFGVMCIISVVFALASGNVAALGGAVLEGAGAALEITLSLIPVMCLWGGAMEVLKRAGAINFFAKLLTPVLKCFFPDAYESGEGREEIAAGIGANLLGIGNAATPIALSAMKKMHAYHVKCGGDADSPSRDMITLAVLNTAAANLMPTTILALRRGAGAGDIFAVVPPIWICSLTSALFALLLTRALGGVKKGGGSGYGAGRTVKNGGDECGVGDEVKNGCGNERGVGDEVKNGCGNERGVGDEVKNSGGSGYGVGRTAKNGGGKGCRAGGDRYGNP